MYRPREYAASNEMQYRHVKDLIEEFPEHFKEMKGRIIDIGCGPGNVTKELLLTSVDQHAIIIGVDLCPAMIDYAREHYEIEDKLSFRQLDIETLELPKNLIGQFDNVVSFYCLQWCKDIKQAMKNLYKILRPGGRAVILTLTHYLIFDVYQEQQKDSRFAPYMQDARTFASPYAGCANAEEMLRENLRETGFDIIHCTHRWKNYTFSGLDSLHAAMTSVNPFLERMPEDLQRDYTNDLKERLKNKCLLEESNRDSRSGSVETSTALLIAIFEKPKND